MASIKNSVLVNMSWMAIRYCLGRKSAICSTFARDIMPVSEFWDDFDREAIARDIYTELNRHITSWLGYLKSAVPEGDPFSTNLTPIAVGINWMDWCGWYNLAQYLNKGAHVHKTLKGVPDSIKDVVVFRTFDSNGREIWVDPTSAYKDIVNPAFYTPNQFE